MDEPSNKIISVHNRMSVIGVPTSFFIAILVLLIFIGLILFYTCTGGSFLKADFNSKKCFKFADYDTLLKENVYGGKITANTMFNFPEMWGDPPVDQTKDIVELPYGFGYGSSTLRDWIIDKAQEYKKYGEKQEQFEDEINKLTDEYNTKLSEYEYQLVQMVESGDSEGYNNISERVIELGEEFEESINRIENDYKEYIIVSQSTSPSPSPGPSSGPPPGPSPGPPPGPSPAPTPGPAPELYNDNRIGNICYAATEWTEWGDCDKSTLKMKRSRCVSQGNLEHEEIDCRCKYEEWSNCSDACGENSYKFRDVDYLTYDNVDWSEGVSCTLSKYEPCEGTQMCHRCCGSSDTMYINVRKWPNSGTKPQVTSLNIEDIYTEQYGGIINIPIMKILHSSDGKRFFIDDETYTFVDNSYNDYRSSTGKEVKINRMRSGQWICLNFTAGDLYIAKRDTNTNKCQYCA